MGQRLGVVAVEGALEVAGGGVGLAGDEAGEGGHGAGAGGVGAEGDGAAGRVAAGFAAAEAQFEFGAAGPGSRIVGVEPRGFFGGGQRGGQLAGRLQRIAEGQPGGGGRRVEADGAAGGGFGGGVVVAGDQHDGVDGSQGGAGIRAEAGDQGAGFVHLAKAQQGAGLEGGEVRLGGGFRQGGKSVESFAETAAVGIAAGGGELLADGVGPGGQFGVGQAHHGGVMDGPGDGVQRAHGNAAGGAAGAGFDGFAGAEALLAGAVGRAYAAFGHDDAGRGVIAGDGEFGAVHQRVHEGCDDAEALGEAADHMHHAAPEAEFAAAGRRRQGQGGVLVEADEDVLAQHKGGAAGAANGDLVAGAQDLPGRGGLPGAASRRAHFDTAFDGAQMASLGIAGQSVGGDAGKGQSQAEIDRPQGESLRQMNRGLHCAYTGRSVWGRAGCFRYEY